MFSIMRRKDLAQQRENVDITICRQYQTWLITEISNISMGNRDENLTVVDKIKSCMKDVKKKVLVLKEILMEKDTEYIVMFQREKGLLI